jgi:hypothetical protein
MGILARITGKSNSTESALSQSGHNINHSQVLKPTVVDVINPLNPGNWSSVRTAPINHDPRYFTKEEADGLKNLATAKADGARQSQRAYKSLKKIESSDAQVHNAHRGYIRGVADSELHKQRANAATGRHLHALRPEYAKLGMGLEAADNKAQNRINELKVKIQGK